MTQEFKDKVGAYYATVAEDMCKLTLFFADAYDKQQITEREALAMEKAILIINNALALLENTFNDITVYHHNKPDFK